MFTQREIPAKKTGPLVSDAKREAELTGTPLDVIIARIKAAPEFEEGGSVDPTKVKGPASVKNSWDPRPEDKKIKLDRWGKMVDQVCEALKESVGNALTQKAQTIYAEVQNQEEFDDRMSEQWEAIFSESLTQVLGMAETYGG